MNWYTCTAIVKSSGKRCAHWATDGFVCGKHTKQAKNIPCNACDGLISHPNQGQTTVCGCAFHHSCYENMLELSHTCMVCNTKTRFSDDDLIEHMNALHKIEKEIQFAHGSDSIITLSHKLMTCINRTPRKLQHSKSNYDKLMTLEYDVINSFTRHATESKQKSKNVKILDIDLSKLKLYA